ncbi:MmcQ/YjbR family DNA-binding protein [Georgenia alba]|uniref:MmcQ/YjbR family DNA-binding protein n=1 Tax=Georgenia alba TaxID=2233858 RepID=A0ABW2Q7V9_9MICO
MPERPDVPLEWIERLAAVFERLPQCREEDAWVGVRWRVRQATVAHVFGGEDGLFRITFRAEPDEVEAFRQMGEPYFKTDWGANVVGIVLDEGTDWDELAEMLVDSFCLQAPERLAAQMQRPARPT